MIDGVTKDFKRSFVVLAFSLSVFSAVMIALPSVRFTNQILLRQVLKYAAYASVLLFNYGALDAIRISEGRPADDRFIEEVATALGLTVFVLGLSESGLIASMF
jgi:hypothetical protein